MNTAATPIKLRARRLPSGRCQVRFTVSARSKDDYYGYLLAEPGESLGSVVGKIRHGIHKLLCNDPLFGLNSHLYSLGIEGQVSQRRIYLFRNRSAN
jgi:hypothetical protein